MNLLSKKTSLTIGKMSTQLKIYTSEALKEPKILRSVLSWNQSMEKNF